jgi:hypothetical protein
MRSARGSKGSPRPELARLRHELASEAGAERGIERRRSDLDEANAAREAQSAQLDAERAALGERPRWSRDAKHEYDRALALLDVKEAMQRRAIERDARERTDLPPDSHDARAEVAVIDGLLDRRRGLALAAARISAPDHIAAELGERPSEGRERAAWDGAARDIEGFRLANGVRDRDSALGPEPDDRAARAEGIRAQDSIRRAQRELGIERVPGIERGQAMEIER